VTSKIELNVDGFSIAEANDGGGLHQVQVRRRWPQVGDPFPSRTLRPRRKPLLPGTRARLPRQIKNERDGYSERQGNPTEDCVRNRILVNLIGGWGELGNLKH
jgi:hypothetical protein